MVLEGMVPVLTHTPPTTARDSTTATRFFILEAGHFGGALSGRPGTDNDKVVFGGTLCVSLQRWLKRYSTRQRVQACLAQDTLSAELVRRDGATLGERLTSM